MFKISLTLLLTGLKYSTRSILNISSLQGWEEAQRRGFRCEKDYCWEYFLSPNTLQVTQLFVFDNVILA